MQQELSKGFTLRLGCYSVSKGDTKKTLSKREEEVVPLLMVARLGGRESATNQMDVSSS